VLGSDWGFAGTQPQQGQHNVNLRETMGENYLITDGFVEAVSSFETLSDSLKQIPFDPYRWKWAILAMHSGLQGMMILALQGSHGLHVLKKEDAKRWLDAHENGGPYPTDLQLDGFLSLYKKIKGELMIMYVDSKKFTPKGTEGDSIKFLNRLRNEYVHFTPRVWAFELVGLPDIFMDCQNIAEFLAWQSGNVFWRESSLKKRIKNAFSLSRSSLLKLREKYENG